MTSRKPGNSKHRMCRNGPLSKAVAGSSIAHSRMQSATPYALVRTTKNPMAVPQEITKRSLTHKKTHSDRHGVLPPSVPWKIAGSP